MRQFDALKADQYVQHLGAVDGALTCEVQTDIYNAFGVLLLPKGARVTPQTALRLAGHSLREPVDRLIGLGKTLSAQRLFEALQDLINQNSDLAAIVRGTDGESLLRHLCLTAHLPLVPMQKLTVMQARFPRLFQRALGATALAVTVAGEQRRSKNFLKNLFVLGLFRDIGLLHVAQTHNDAESPPQYSTDTEHHGDISAAILALESQIDKQVIAGIRDHHERPDGVGFPRYRHGEQVTPLSWLIGSMDHLWSIREFAGEALDTPGMRTYLQINAGKSTNDPYARLRAILMRIPVTTSSTNPGADTREIVQCLRRRNQLIANIKPLLEELNEALSKRATGPDIALTLNAVVDALLQTLRNSGLGSDYIDGLLDNASSEDSSALHELLDLDLALTEFLWRIRRLSRLRDAAPWREHPELELAERLIPEIDNLLSQESPGRCATPRPDTPEPGTN